MSEWTIERLGHLGDGIAQGPIFALGALPGEVVTGTIEGDRLHDLRIVTPSSDRVRPPCPHAKRCGGCQLQHASDGFVADWKKDIVRKALSAHGLSPDILGPVTSPPQTRRRAAISARRTKSGALVGFHAKGSDVIVPIPDCRLLDPALIRALPHIETIVPKLASRKAEVTAHLTTSQTGLDLDLSGIKPLTPQLLSEIAAWALQAGIVRVSVDGETVVTHANPAQSFGNAAMVPPPGAFLQATPQGESALRSVVETAVQGASNIADLFAGCGTFALPLSRNATVHAVESDAEMLTALETGWRHSSGHKALTTETRDLFRNPLLTPELAKFDAVVIDPPRAGAEAQVAELAQAKPAVIAHVSCNPATFARDCAQLEMAGYTLGPVTVVDQFHWSTHVEVVSALTLP